MVKPPPPPPKFRGAKKPAPLKRSFETIVRQLKHYKLPMATETTPAWVAVLKECGFPGDVLVLDFETYFAPDFRMAGTGDGLSTIEYIEDPRFEILGLAWLHMQAALPFRDYEANTAFVYEESAVDQHIKYLHVESRR